MLVLAGTASLADSSHYTAALAQPISAKKEVVAEGNIWHCEASVCVLVSVPNNPNSLFSCRELRHLVGPLSSYGTEGKLFDADKLAKCNS
jgi:hypothetical protein